MEDKKINIKMSKFSVWQKLLVKIKYLDLNKDSKK